MKDRTVTPAPKQKSPSEKTQEVTSVLKIWGKKPLSGCIPISGAKNSALAILAGTLLCPGECRISNVPSLADIGKMSQVLTALGLKLERHGDVLEIDASNVGSARAPYELVSKLRASFFIVGPLLARLGSARVPLPGGCAIGARPVDLHVRGLQALGADVRIEQGVVCADVKGRNRRLTGAKIYLDYPSVGATETLMMAAVLAEGETTIQNAAREPEVVDLANFCRAMGAEIYGAGTNTITIIGVPQLHSVDYPIVADRIEAGTFLVAAAITHSELSIAPVVPDHLTPVIAKLREIGAKVAIDRPDTIRLIPGELRATDIETLPYPGFPTDMQAQFMALLTLAEGNSVITETVFENRLRHVAELSRMGADIRVKGQNAIVRGVPNITGVPVMGTDLRATAALVIAGLGADGMTVVKGLHHLDRGYENIEQKLRNVGAQLERVTVPVDRADDLSDAAPELVQTC